MVFTYARWKKQESERKSARHTLDQLKADANLAALMTQYASLRVLSAAIEERYERLSATDKILAKLHAKYENDPASWADLSESLDEHFALWGEVFDLYDALFRELKLANNQGLKASKKKASKKMKESTGLASALIALWEAEKEKPAKAEGKAKKR